MTSVEAILFAVNFCIAVVVGWSLYHFGRSMRGPKGETGATGATGATGPAASVTCPACAARLKVAVEPADDPG